ncbi:MAG: hypothetical protein HQ495_12930 [Alphaproteobacteria bacterium]|nr:hypothetical protein [Alphaproteobacteria bacterium]
MLAQEDIAHSLPILASLRRTDRDIGAVLNGVSYDLLIASAGDGYELERAAVRIVRSGGGRTIQFVDAWYNYERRFSSGDLFPDVIAVIDDQARLEAIAEGLPPELLVTVGHPWLEAVPRWIPGPRSQVLVLGAPIRRDYGRTLGYDEYDIWSMIVDARRRDVGSFDGLWYAPHPEQLSGGIPDISVGEVTIGSTEPYLRRAGTVLGAFAAPMIDAYLCGARVVSVQPNASSRDMCALSRRGMIPRATSTEELIDALSARCQGDVSELNQVLVGSASRLNNLIAREIAA